MRGRTPARAVRCDGARKRLVHRQRARGRLRRDRRPADATRLRRPRSRSARARAAPSTILAARRRHAFTVARPSCAGRRPRRASTPATTSSGRSTSARLVAGPGFAGAAAAAGPPTTCSRIDDRAVRSASDRRCRDATVESSRRAAHGRGVARARSPARGISRWRSSTARSSAASTLERRRRRCTCERELRRGLLRVVLPLASAWSRR